MCERGTDYISIPNSQGQIIAANARRWLMIGERRAYIRHNTWIVLGNEQEHQVGLDWQPFDPNAEEASPEAQQIVREVFPALFGTESSI